MVQRWITTNGIAKRLTCQILPTLANDILSAGKDEKKFDIPYGVEIRSWDLRGLPRSFILPFPLASSLRMDF